MSDAPAHLSADVVVVGGGAAGLATCIFAARRSPRLRIVCLDGAKRVGAKILVSGGSRCNVTNRTVNEGDFWGGSPRVIRNVLRTFPAERAAAFFEQIGVALHEEEDGKLFPDSNRSRTVLDALLRECDRLGVEIRAGQRVQAVTKDAPEFIVSSTDERWTARHVVLATGGRSLPRSGSDGFGYELARRLGHTCVETTPALAPLVLDGSMHQPLSGVSHRAVLEIRRAQSRVARLEGAILWTHFGISGPLALNASRHWHRAALNGHDVEAVLNVCPGETFESLERWLIDQSRERSKALVSTVLASRLPAAVGQQWLVRAKVAPDTTMAHLSKEGRRDLVRALLDTRLPVTGSRGYNFAEVTAGGVPLEEIDAARMESRVCPGLFLVGEMLDADGRLGGFNFQWAWSSGWIAGHAVAAGRPAPLRT
jgi:predicted Rossmann fold flavoprotein